MSEDGRRGHHHAETARRSHRARGAERLVHGADGAPRVAAATPLEREVRGSPAGVADALPPLAHRQIGIPVALQPGVDLLLQSFVVGHGPAAYCETVRSPPV